MTFDDNLEDEVKVTIIATGFQQQSEEAILKNPKRDILGRKVKPKAENFISRGINKEESETEEEETDPKEDLETPAFIRKRLNQ